MPTWQLTVDVEGKGDATLPVFVRIARAVSDDINRGRLKPGQRLPGTRSLARALGVHRNTVVAAFDELSSQGWIRTETARGTFVANVPEGTFASRAPVSPSKKGVAAETGYVLRGRTEPLPPKEVAGALYLAGGRPDPRLFPGEELGRAYRRALRRHAAAVLDYGDPHGEDRLREAIAAMVSDRRGIPATLHDVTVTRGAQMALWLVAKALILPGERVAVEAYGYGPAWQAFRDAGAELRPVRVDREGMRVDDVEALISRGKLRAVYVTPHHQFPTMAVLSASRRIALLDLCRRHGVALVEDDYDNEFHYDGRSVLPLASLDPSGVVVYIGTLSKVLAPGLRLGFVIAPRTLIERIASHRVVVDRQGDLAMERAVAELMEDGTVQRHVLRVRRIYEARRDALAVALREQLEGVVDFDVPTGGLAIWATVAGGVDTDEWCREAGRRGVLFQPGGFFAFDGKAKPAARFGYARLEESELVEAVRRLRTALPARGYRKVRLR